MGGKEGRRGVWVNGMSIDGWGKGGWFRGMRIELSFELECFGAMSLDLCTLSFLPLVPSI